jgi:cysteine desulfurase
MIYLNHDATTPPASGVVQAMLEVMCGTWANASSQRVPRSLACWVASRWK